MDTTTTVSEVARRFSDFIDRVAFRGERFVLTRRGRPVAELAPTVDAVTLRDLPSLLEGLPRLGGEEAEAFGRDLEKARKELAEAEDHDPWES